MKKLLISKYENYISFAEMLISTEKDADKISVLSTCIYCYKEILRDLKQPENIDKQFLLKKFDEAVRQPNMIVGDSKLCLKVMEDYIKEKL